MLMYKFFLVIVSFFFRIIYRIKVNGIENIPENETFMVSANHIHILDPIIVAMQIKPQVHFLSKKEIFSNKFFAWVFNKLGVIPVDRNNNDLKAIKACFKVLRNGKVLGIFPEGTRVKNVSIDNFKKGAVMIALKSKVPILPIHIEGTYRIFSKIKVDIYPVIQTIEFENIDESEAIEKLNTKLFNSIYQ